MGRKSSVAKPTEAGATPPLANQLRTLLANARQQVTLISTLLETLKQQPQPLNDESSKSGTESPAATAPSAGVEEEAAWVDAMSNSQFGLQVLRELSPQYYAREIEPKRERISSPLPPPAAYATQPSPTIGPVRTIRNRMDTHYKNRTVCDDCGKRGSGSRSQSGITYYYCRNGNCSGKGAGPDRFIGWTQHIPVTGSS